MTHIMLDLEMNMCKKKTNGKNHSLSHELIEIGAVKMDDKFEIIDKFQTYVNPDLGPMDKRIIKITHITDDMLVGAPKYDEAMEMFVEWIGEGDITYYSWSLSDLRQLQAESSFKSSHEGDVKRMSENWIDFQKEFGDLLKISKRIRLKDAVGSANYTFQGAQHTALADAVNTAEILILSKDKKKFDEVMKPVIDLFAPYDSGSSLGAMCADFFNSFSEESEDSENSEDK